MNWLQAQIFQFYFTHVYKYKTCNRTTLGRDKVYSPISVISMRLKWKHNPHILAASHRFLTNSDTMA